jgi:hypothetical protein
MQYWIAALAVALLVVVGYAAGPLGAVVTLLAFLIALFLLWARDLGFKGAWTKFGLNRFSPPLWKRENWEQFEGIFVDRDKVVKACAIALALIALSMMLPKNLVILAFLAVAVWFIVEIYRGDKPAATLTRNDNPRIN